MKHLALYACLLCMAPPVLAVPVCILDVTDLAFGSFTVNGLDGDPQATASVSVDCSDDGNPTVVTSADYSITMSAGMGGSYAPRSMPGTGNALDYNIYLDPSHTDVWGDGSGATQVLEVTGHPFPSEQVYTVYGKVPGLQAGVHPGTYMDTISVELAF